MAIAFFLLWLVMSILITDAREKGKWYEDPEIRQFLEESRQDLRRYKERKALGGFEIIPLEINGRIISEELRDLMELNVIRSLGLPVDFNDTMPTELPSTPVSKRSGMSTMESESSEQMDEGFLNSPIQVGSIKGVPGVHFPDYTDIPITSFSCADKPHLPGFYADLDTGCQVFHVCWNDRRETLLCPIGTTFNQALLACDYWYSSNCSLAPNYYSINEGKKFDVAEVKEKDDLRSMIDAFLGSDAGKSKSVDSSEGSAIPDSALSFVTQFMPVKAKVTIYPESEGQRSKIVASASIGRGKKLTRKVKSHQGKISSIELASTNTGVGSSEIQSWCLSYRHFAYRINKVLDEILYDLKKLGSVNNDLELAVVKTQEFLRYLDPEFDKFDISEANYETEKRIEDFIKYLPSIADAFFNDREIIQRANEDLGKTNVGLGSDYGLLEMILNKIKMFMLLSNSTFDKFGQEKSNYDADHIVKDGGLSDLLQQSEYDGVTKTAPVTSKSVEEVPLCGTPKCETLPKPTLTPLNPRFVTKPHMEKAETTIGSDSPPLKKSKGSKLFMQAKSPLLASKKAPISEETKKALLLNYMKLLKIAG